MQNIQLLLRHEDDTVAMGSRLASAFNECNLPSLVILLNGDLGAGKTTLTRGFVHAMGFTGMVKSPTYTLVEPYESDSANVYHFDLYRLADPEELEYLGVRDYFGPGNISLIEWPEKATGYLPDADLVINMSYIGEQRNIEIVAKTPIGQSVVEYLT